jgi:LmbE family N-acetylglucosaminyl deacetylase
MEYWTPASALVLTNGAAGSSDASMTRERLTGLREAEQRAAAKVVGVDRVEFLGYEDGLLEPTLEVRKDIVRLIRRVRPEVVVTTDPTTRYFSDVYINHPDHRAAGEATLAAVIPGSDTRLAYPELLDEGLEPVKLKGVWLMMNERPNLVVDISDVIDRKLESLRCHVSQMGDDATPESIAFVYDMAEWAASEQPFRYGETFRAFRFDQPGRTPEPPAGA